MTMPHRYMFLAVFTLLALINVASGATEACLPAGQRKSGMNINFYQYSLKDSSTYSNAAYMAYGYASKTKLGSVGGQTDISIDYNIPCVSSSDTFPCPQEDSYGNWGCKGMGACSNSQGIAYWSTDLFGFYTTPTNVTLEMTGYFLPPQTGSYTFKFATVDDSAILSVGGATAFDCCAQQQPPITSTNFTINGIKPWGGSLPPNVEGTVYMYAGFYYPMKVVYSNAVSWGTLPISVTLPDGTAISDDFEGYVYSFDDDLTQSDCTIPDPSNYTITGLISTTTEPWTGTFTSTSTEMTTVTGTNGQPTDETVIVIRTPTSEGLITTTTEPWTGTFTSTSTEVITITGTNGQPTDETVIVIRTPTSEGLITTTTEPWTGTFTSTSTEMTTVTGTNGQPTDETVIVIRTPTSEGLITTTTEPWTGTFTSTSTEVITITGTNGQPTDETVIVIRTPTSEGLITTTTEPWTGTFTSTSTEMTTVTGTNGQPTDETVIVIRTPTSEGLITTTTEPWTGTFTSTSTEVTTITGTNGQPTDETVIVIRTPTTAISSSLSSSSGQITSSITSSRPIITPFYPSNGTSVISSSVISSSVTSSLVTSSSFISSSVISSSTTTSTSIFSESSTSSVIPTSSSTSGSSESKTSSASSSSSSSSISSESPKSPTYSSSSLPPVTSATTGQETASSLPPATTTKTSEQTTLVTVTSCESHVCTESISSAIVSTATVIVSGVTTEYTTWCPISTTEITKQTTETTKQTKGTTEQTTETTKQTTVVTISSCESDICSKTASPAIVSTSTATINGVTTEYTTWCPISTTESKQQTTLVTVTSCESGVCSETASPAIVSTATATVNDVVTVYPTWRPQTTNEQSVSSKMNSATSETTTNTGAAETKTAVTSSLSRFNHAETQTASATDVIGHSSSVVSVSETGNTKSLTSSGLSTMSQQPRSTPASSMVGSSTASLEISTYAGSANSLLAGSGLSVFIASLLLAII
ncbi:ASB_HP2_G0000920.mRNA.1.CDS.1 [Saccharomyces cerevisiae]|nr:ASB_HP2_G0000920.mRNA.1.CDS.1 [Saccharomyces cerevisiae]CAI6381794.1 ASB_HP2_G0000920.mRNA.1.CDS.1 [Saccharomyces cerevisiae]